MMKTQNLKKNVQLIFFFSGNLEIAYSIKVKKYVTTFANLLLLVGVYHHRSQRITSKVQKCRNKVLLEQR